MSPYCGTSDIEVESYDFEISNTVSQVSQLVSNKSCHVDSRKATMGTQPLSPLFRSFAD